MIKKLWRGAVLLAAGVFCLCPFVLFAGYAFFSPWAAAGYLLMALACCAVVVLYARRKLPLWLAGGLFVALNAVMVPYAQTFGEFKEEFLQSMCLEHGGAEWDAARGRCVGGSYNL